jgi:purine-binding chemotaxis protein CheW
MSAQMQARNMGKGRGGAPGADLPKELMTEFVTVIIDGQMLGIPVLIVDDVLGARSITPVPLSPKAVAGVLNLRGRIVTAIDVRRRLGLAPLEDRTKCMSVVVEHNGEPYSLLVDSVGEVLAINSAQCHANPPTLPENWRAVSKGIYQLEDELLLLLDVGGLLTFTQALS